MISHSITLFDAIRKYVAGLVTRRKLKLTDRELKLIYALERARVVMEHTEGATETDNKRLMVGMSEATDVLEALGPPKTDDYWAEVKAFSAPKRNDNKMR